MVSSVSVCNSGWPVNGWQWTVDTPHGERGLPLLNTLQDRTLVASFLYKLFYFSFMVYQWWQLLTKILSIIWPHVHLFVLCHNINLKYLNINSSIYPRQLVGRQLQPDMRSTFLKQQFSLLQLHYTSDWSTSMSKIVPRNCFDSCLLP